ncbi:MAG: DUF6489 family protein [Rhodospirillaceae bacterium]
MKITVDVDCTPEEARAFLGLPDLRPLQHAFVAQLQERLSANLQAMDGDALLRSWLPAGSQGFEAFTKALMAQFDLALGRERKS